jgi:preprotein translocase subunit YajC
VESLIFLIVMFALMWVLFVLPRQRMQRRHQDMVGSLRLGDEVITSAGIYGTVVDLDPDVAHVRVAEGVVLRVARLAIGRRLGGGDGPAPRDETTRDGSAEAEGPHEGPEGER